jgi:hypothetical protein
LNSDLRRRNIKVLARARPALVNEWTELTWLDSALNQGRWVEHPKKPNHASDATLYAYTFARHFWVEGQVPVRQLSEEERCEIEFDKQNSQREIVNSYQLRQERRFLRSQLKVIMDKLERE